jgi:hypothetical protein
MPLLWLHRRKTLSDGPESSWPNRRIARHPHRKRLAFNFSLREYFCAGVMFQSGQLVRVNLAGLQAEGVMFQAAVTDAVGHIVKQTSEQPPKYLVKLLFSFRGVTEVEVPADRIHADR